MAWRRSLWAFIVLPGVVAFAVPAAIAWMWHRSSAFDATGLVPGAVGLVVLLWCVRDFHRFGHGTLAPWAPPTTLVTSGAYRWSRNPMYVGVVSILVAWAWCLHSGVHAVYAAAVAVGFHLRVVLGEEPWLERTFGEAWRTYRARVRRWL